VAPQTPSQSDSKLIPAGHRYTEKTVPGGAAPKPSLPEKKSLPVGLIIGVIFALAAVGGSLFFLLGPKTVAVVNPSFEAPVTDDHIYTPLGDPWMYSVRTGDSGSGVAADHDAFTAGNPPAPKGRQVAFLQGKGTSISQVVSGFVPGKHYTITFNAAQRANLAQTGQTWDVAVNGVTIKSFAPLQAVNEYAVYSAGFTANTAVSTIAFVATDINGGDNTVFLDNVRITTP
jgi:hypothetical protein